MSSKGKRCLPLNVFSGSCQPRAFDGLRNHVWSWSPSLYTPSGDYPLPPTGTLKTFVDLDNVAMMTCAKGNVQS